VNLFPPRSTPSARLHSRVAGAPPLGPSSPRGPPLFRTCHLRITTLRSILVAWFVRPFTMCAQFFPSLYFLSGSDVVSFFVYLLASAGRFRSAAPLPRRRIFLLGLSTATAVSRRSSPGPFGLVTAVFWPPLTAWAPQNWATWPCRHPFPPSVQDGPDVSLLRSQWSFGSSEPFYFFSAPASFPATSTCPTDQRVFFFLRIPSEGTSYLRFAALTLRFPSSV